MIYVLYGQPASGKTTLGKLLAEHLDTPFVLDDDGDYAELFSLQMRVDFLEYPSQLNRNANAVATYLNICNNYHRTKLSPEDMRGHSFPKADVVMTLVNPYKHLREELRGESKRRRVGSDAALHPLELRSGYYYANNKDQVVEVLLRSNRRRGGINDGGVFQDDLYHFNNFEIGNPDYTLDTDQGTEDSWNQLKDLLKI